MNLHPRSSFSLGAILTSLLGLVVIPGHSCPDRAPDDDATLPCDLERDNNGWRIMFFALTAVVSAQPTL